MNCSDSISYDLLAGFVQAALPVHFPVHLPLHFPVHAFLLVQVAPCFAAVVPSLPAKAAVEMAKLNISPIPYKRRFFISVLYFKVELQRYTNRTTKEIVALSYLTLNLNYCYDQKRTIPIRY